MPISQYEGEKCGHKFDLRRSVVQDDGEITCPKSGAPGKLKEINLSKEILITKIAISITLAASALAAWLLFDLLFTYLSSGIIWRAIAQVTFISYCTVLWCISSLV